MDDPRVPAGSSGPDPSTSPSDSPEDEVAAEPVLRGEHVVLVPVTGEHVPELRRILHTPEVSCRWGDEAASPQWPFDDLIDPAADNEPAIRCYTAVGFRPVGVLRRYERDAGGTGWHDGLLMDLLAEELDQPR